MSNPVKNSVSKKIPCSKERQLKINICLIFLLYLLQKKQDEICMLYSLTIFWKNHCQAYGWLMPLTTLCAVLAKLIVVISAYPTNVFILIDVLSNHFHTI